MNKIKTGIMALMASGVVTVVPMQISAAEGLRIEHLGVNNTLVRIDSPEKYLLLPVFYAIIYGLIL